MFYALPIFLERDNRVNSRVPCREENLPWWMEVKEVLSKYGIDENTHVTEWRREMKAKCEQWWLEELCEK